MDVKDQRIAELETLLHAALEENVQLRERLAVLEKNSRNSSKPPSSDIVKPPKAPKNKGKNKGKLKRGGQPGHKQNLRKPLAPGLIDEIVKHELTACPDCGHQLDLVRAKRKSLSKSNWSRNHFSRPNISN